ncbi:hypothetical protein DNTS_008150 [Danionella cerebrum]|uniref:CCDC66 domain-containing protein n=1 Tax=Danionella cerebrum TaxID=2873325 RepID=A0A553PUS5_9TELE|nr:hypothetical protein DNTS_008150 [Danionella translucida]
MHFPKKKRGDFSRHAPSQSSSPDNLGVTAYFGLNLVQKDSAAPCLLQNKSRVKSLINNTYWLKTLKHKLVGDCVKCRSRILAEKGSISSQRESWTPHQSTSTEPTAASPSRDAPPTSASDSLQRTHKHSLFSSERITITHGSSVDPFTEHRALSRVLFAMLMSSSSRYPHSDISWKRSIIFTIASLVRHGDAQIAEKEERKQREREEQRKRDLKLEGEQEKYTYWGRGGGGAPLKDISGNLITDLKAHLRKPNPCETVARGEARPASRKKESASFSPAPPSTYGRGNVFEEGLTSHQRNQDQRHRDFLKLQIEENKRRQEEEREKVRMEEEREERRITREREIMKKEYEAELEKRKRKDREEKEKRTTKVKEKITFSSLAAKIESERETIDERLSLGSDRGKGTRR